MILSKFKLILKNLIDIVPGLMALYRHNRDYFIKFQKPKKTKWNFLFAGNESMSSGQFEIEETEIIRKHFKDCDLLINIGANIGYYCCHALSLGLQVVAVEPLNSNLNLLMKNITVNGWNDKTHIFPVALGKKNGISQIWGSGTGASLTEGWANIPKNFSSYTPVLSLDQIINNEFQKKKKFYLIDVEGHEYQLLLGAKENLKSNPKSIWFIEISYKENLKINKNFFNTFKLFFKYGYRAYTANRDMLEITTEVLDDIYNEDTKVNTHNFIFM